MSGRTAGTARDAAWGRPREREAVRAAILEAARRLLERDGAENVTLTAVAGEAHMARATLYGYFSSRQALLTQIEEAPAPRPVPAEAPAAESEATEIQEESSGDYGELMQTQADALQELARRVIVPKSLAKEGTDSVLVRVETRLGVAEKSGADLARRLDGQTKDLAAQISSVSDALERLKERLDSFERRQQTAVAELRLAVHNLGARPAEPAVPAAEPFVPEAPPEEPAPAKPAPVAYLSTARQAARVAAEEAEKLAGRSARPRFRRNKRLWQLLVLAALAVAAFDILVLTSYPPRAATMQPVAVPASRPKPPGLEERAARGDAAAQLALGVKLLNGTGMRADVKKAVAWLQKAAAAGQPVAQNFVGIFYQTGTGVPVDITAALRWYEAAAGRGNVKAMSNLGKVYAGGWADGTDYVKAAEWFQRAAVLGDLDAQFDLAILYERGQGVSRSIPDAYKWYAIAAAHGDKHAAARVELLGARLKPRELQAARADAAAFAPGKPERAANAVPPL